MVFISTLQPKMEKQQYYSVPINKNVLNVIYFSITEPVTIEMRICLCCTIPAFRKNA